MTWKLDDNQLRIVGGYDAYEGEAAFSRCAVVLRRGDAQRRLLVSHYQGSEALGTEIDEQDWRGLLDSGDALELPAPLPAFPGAALWLLRQPLSGRAERVQGLRLRGAAVLTGPHEVQVAVVDEAHLGHLRDCWTHDAVTKACALAKSGAMTAAVQEAEQAFVLARSLQVQPVALLTALYRLAGRRPDADALLEMAQRSRGEVFARDARQQAEDYVNTLPRERPPALWPGERSLERRRKCLALSKDGLRAHG